MYFLFSIDLTPSLSGHLRSFESSSVAVDHGISLHSMLLALLILINSLRALSFFYFVGIIELPLFMNLLVSLYWDIPLLYESFGSLKRKDVHNSCATTFYGTSSKKHFFTQKCIYTLGLLLAAFMCVVFHSKTMLLQEVLNICIVHSFPPNAFLKGWCN